MVQEVLRSRDVVLATCVGAATYSLRDQEFDLVVIDEAAQVMDVVDRSIHGGREGREAKRPSLHRYVLLRFATRWFANRR